MFSGDTRRLDQLAGERLAEKLLTKTEAERAVLLKRLLDSKNEQLIVETAESIQKRVTNLDASTKQIIQKAAELLKPLRQELVEARLDLLTNEF